MSDKQLRSELVKLAHSNPDLRPHLLPLLKTAISWQNMKLVEPRYIEHPLDARMKAKLRMAISRLLDAEDLVMKEPDALDSFLDTVIEVEVDAPY